jgi:hypothetical protein
LTEAWTRYHIPLAVTECHLCCTREEQLRWLGETWSACTTLKKGGIAIRAVTAWCLLGAYDWNSLLEQETFFYESGVFNLREKRPRPTLLAKMILSLSKLGFYKHPLLAQRGWWIDKSVQPQPATTVNIQPLLIIGKNKLVTERLSGICHRRSIPNHIITRDSDFLLSTLIALNPWAIINASSFNEPGFIEPGNTQEDDPELVLARFCGGKSICFLSLLKHNDHSRHKNIMSLNPSALLINLAPVNIFIEDKFDEIMDALVDLLIDEENGIFKISAEGRLTRTNEVATTKI